MVERLPSLEAYVLSQTRCGDLVDEATDDKGLSHSAFTTSGVSPLKRSAIDTADRQRRPIHHIARFLDVRCGPGRGGRLRCVGKPVDPDVAKVRHF